MKLLTLCITLILSTQTSAQSDSTASKSLREINISTKKSVFKSSESSTIINIENTALATSMSSTEVLSKLPKVSVVGTTVNIFGAGEALIYIGRQHISYQTLMSIPPAQIKLIEINTHPGAQYDAKGRAVIIITLKKVKKDQTICTLNGTAKYAMHPFYDGKISIESNKNKWSITSNYGQQFGTEWNQNNYGTVIKSTSGIFNTIGLYNERGHSTIVSNYRLGVGYEIDNTSSLSIQYDGLYNLFHLDVKNRELAYSPSKSLTDIQMRNAALTENVNHSLNLNYNKTTDTLGSNFFTGVQYNNFQTGIRDSIHEIIIYSPENASNSIKKNIGDNYINLFVAQADRHKVLDGNNSLDIGMKISYISNIGRVKILKKDIEANDFSELKDYRNGSAYKELLSSLYTSYTRAEDKLNYTVGLRAEHAFVKGYSTKYMKYIIYSSYINFFPSASFTYTINENWNTTLSYNRRINRPIYQDLDPFVWYLDSIASIQGNPSLTPEVANAFECYISQKLFNLKIGYTHTQNSIRPVVINGNAGENSAKYSKINIEHYYQYNASLEVPFENKIISSYNNIAINLNKIKDSRYPYLASIIAPQMYLYTYNTIQIPKICSIDINAEYYGAFNDGITDKKPYYFASVGITKNFLHKKLQCSIWANDIFRTAENQGMRTIGKVISSFDQLLNTQYIRLNIIYKIGGMKVNKYNNREVAGKEVGRIKM
jgi:hypothetical protein